MIVLIWLSFVARDWRSSYAPFSLPKWGMLSRWLKILIAFNYETSLQRDRKESLRKVKNNSSFAILVKGAQNHIENSHLKIIIKTKMNSIIGQRINWSMTNDWVFFSLIHGMRLLAYLVLWHTHIKNKLISTNIVLSHLSNHGVIVHCTTHTEQVQLMRFTLIGLDG